MTASFEGHTDVVQTLIEAKAQINTQKEVCCSYHQKTHIITHSVTVYSCTRWGDCVFVSTGWLDCSSPGSSRRQSWCGETTDWSSGSGQHTDWGKSCLMIMVCRKSPLGISHDDVCWYMYLQDGRTPLYIASCKGHGAVVKLLLQQHADVSICRKVMWLHRSSMCLYDFTILL